MWFGSRKSKSKRTAFRKCSKTVFQNLIVKGKDSEGKEKLLIDCCGEVMRC